MPSKGSGVRAALSNRRELPEFAAFIMIESQARIAETVSNALVLNNHRKYISSVVDNFLYQLD